MTAAYESKRGDKLAFSRCDNGHLIVVATSAAGTSVLVCVEPEAVPAVISEMRAWAQPPADAEAS
jgi:hypothetical protein